jgi:hypothetical protein
LIHSRENLLNPVEIAAQCPGVGEEVVAEENRLPSLQMRVPGDQGAAVVVDPVEEHRDQIADDVRQPTEATPQPQTDISRHLIVARSCGVKLASDFTDQLRETDLDRHVDVFLQAVGFPVSGADLAENLLQSVAEGRGFVLVKDPNLLEHRHMRQGALEVLLRDPSILFE